MADVWVHASLPAYLSLPASLPCLFTYGLIIQTANTGSLVLAPRKLTELELEVLIAKLEEHHPVRYPSFSSPPLSLPPPPPRGGRAVYG